MKLIDFCFSYRRIYSVFVIIICIVGLNHSAESEYEVNDHPKLLRLKSCLSSMQKMKFAYDLELEAVLLIESLYEIFKVTHEIDEAIGDVEEIVQKFVKYVIDLHEKESKLNYTFLHHPVNSLHFSRRIVNKFNAFLMTLKEQSIRSIIYKKFEDMIVGKIVSLGCWFKSTDEDVLMSSLARVYSTYRPPIKEFIAGDIYGYKSTDELGLEDFLSSFYTLHENGYHEDVIDITDNLLEELRDKIKEMKLERRLYRMKANSLFKLGQSKEAIKILEVFLKENDDPSSRRDLKRYNDKKNSTGKEEPFIQSIYDYRKICRGIYEVPALTCRYHCPQKGWYCIQNEVISKTPYVIRYYNIIHDDEIEVMKSLAIERLQLSKIRSSGKINDKTKPDYRLSETSWIYDKDSPVTDGFSKRIEFITGLVTSPKTPASCEPFQVVNYGLAGMYYAHWDYLQNDKEREKGPYEEDRTATWITYLSNVELGGGTVFINKNLLVPSIKGSAVFWYNIRRNGSRIVDTFHGGCPVLVGDKWISNKWFTEDSQMFNYKCIKNRKRL